MSWELSIKLGTYTFWVGSESIDLSDEVPGQLQGFRFQGETDFRVMLRAANHTKERNEGPEESFKIKLSGANRDIRVDIEGLNAALDMKVLGMILSFVYSHAVVTNDSNAAILHAAAVSYHDRGFVFVGPSGAGKSTISELLLDAQATDKFIEIINDEMIIIESSSHGHWIYPTPFGPTVPYDPNLVVPLSAIFVLEKAQTPRVERIHLAESITHILKQIILRDFVVPGFMDITPSQRFDFACKLTARTPMYRLHFAKDLSFLPVLDEVCNETPVVLEGVAK